MSVKLPLERLIALAITNKELFKKSVPNIKSAIDRGIDYNLSDDLKLNVDYVVNKLSDIIRHQFGKDNLCLREGISNSLDAGATQITVIDSRDTITIDDNGSGMDFETLLYNLNLPFCSDKIKQIGRFGLGFYSMLGVLAKDGYVSVDTRKDDQAYTVVYEKSDEGITVSYDKSDRTDNGTTISLFQPPTKLKTSLGDKILDFILPKFDRRKHILKDYFSFIDPSRSELFYSTGGKPKRVNHGFDKLKKSTVYNIEFADDEIRVAITRNKKNYGHLDLLSGGVSIYGESFTRQLEAVVDYPLSVEPVEARNDFIRSEHLDRAEELVFSKALLPYLKDNRTKFKRNDFKEILHELFATKFVRSYTQHCSKPELLELIEMYTGVPIPENQDLLYYCSSDRNPFNNIYRLFSNSRVFTSEFPLSLNNNPHVTQLKDIIKDSRKVDYGELTAEDFERYHLSRIPINKNNSLKIFFIDGLPADTTVPCASGGPFNKGGCTQLYVNSNHRLFNDDAIPQSTRDLSLNYYITRCFFDAKVSEEIAFGGSS